MNRNKMACECNNVTYGKIEDAIKAGSSSFEEFRNRPNVGKAVASARILLNIC